MSTSSSDQPTTKRKALISVFEKTPSLIIFARSLIELDFEIISSGGTAQFLETNSVPVTDVAEITGQPAILGHKVVTLHPAVHGGLLASEDQLEELAQLGFPKIDLLYVTFYPLSQEVAREGSTFESCIKLTDIGGPTMVRSAVKGGEVIVMTKASQQDGILMWLRDGEPNRRAILDALRGKAEYAVAEYIQASAEVHSEHHNLDAGVRYGL